MDINERILRAYNLSERNIDITEIFKKIDADIYKSNSLNSEMFDLYDKLKYKYDKEYKKDIDVIFENILGVKYE